MRSAPTLSIAPCLFERAALDLLEGQRLHVFAGILIVIEFAGILIVIVETDDRYIRIRLRYYRFRFRNAVPLAELNVLRDDFGHPVRDAILIIPAPGLKTPLYERERAFRQIGACEFREFPPRNDIVKFCALLFGA